MLDAEWNLLMANAGVQRLLALLGLPMPDRAPHLLDWLLHPEGLRSRLLKKAEVCGQVLHRARRESMRVPVLGARLARLRSSAGELRLFSMFSTFGAPLVITLASLRIDYLFAANAATWTVRCAPAT